MLVGVFFLCPHSFFNILHLLPNGGDDDDENVVDFSCGWLPPKLHELKIAQQQQQQ
jgi:hypothetical protein